MSESELIKILTPREKDVVRLLADGYGYKGVGAELGVSVKTVSCYRQRVTEKLMQRGIKQMNSIAMLTKFAIRAGITTLALCLLGSRLQAQAGTTVLISWDTPSPQFASSIVLLVVTTNPALPTNQWPVLMPVFSPTNISPTRQGVYTNLTPNAYFISATWTNTFWHTNSPFFSAAAATPPIQTNLLNNLQISAP